MVQDAAASSLGKMFVKFAKEYDIKVVNIVRRQEQVDMLKQLGADNVLNSSDTGFMQHFEDLSIKVQPKFFFS